MRIENPLKAAIQNLKVGGKPILVTTDRERVNAHNFARYYKVKIKTQFRMDRTGWMVGRVG